MDNQPTDSQPKGVNKFILLCALFLALYICVLSPLTIVMGNVDEFDNGFIEIFYASIPYFLQTLVILSVPLLIPHKFLKIKTIYLSLLTIGLTFAVINSQFLYGDYGAFDGRGLTIDTFSMLSFTQLLILAGVVLVVAFTKLRNSLVVMVSMFAVVTFGIHFSTFLNSGIALSKVPQVASSDFVKFSKDQPNYLYILLDEVYGGSTEEIFKTNKELADKFTGFTNYTNTASLFPTTVMSIPTILTEKVYQDGENQDEYFRKSVEESPLLNTLETKEYDYKIQTISFRDHLPKKAKSSMGSLGGNAQTPRENYLQNLNLSLFKTSPDILKGVLYVNGDWRFSSSSYMYYIKEFDYFANQLDASNPSPTFRFYHTTLTHSPTKFDRNCQQKSLKGSFETYLGQDTCGFVQVSKLIDKLKVLGIYDNTYIIVSSDHGRSSIEPDMTERFSSSPVKNTVYGHAHATLMIKPMKSNEPFKNDTSPRSLVDLSPIIMASINNETSVTYAKRRYHYYKWEHKYWNEETLPPFLSVYTIGNDIKNPADWVLDDKFVTRVVEVTPETVIKPLTPRTQISFNTDYNKEGQNVYGSQGLSQVEDWGRWSDGKEVRLSFLPQGFVPHQVTFELRAQLHKRHKVQHATVSLNGESIGVVKFEYQSDKILRKLERSKTFAFNLPSDVLKLGVPNTIEFHIDNPVSPESLGVNDDSRLLGIGFESMTFE